MALYLFGVKKKEKKNRCRLTLTLNQVYATPNCYTYTPEFAIQICEPKFPLWLFVIFDHILCCIYESSESERERGRGKQRNKRNGIHTKKFSAIRDGNMNWSVLQKERKMIKQRTKMKTTKKMMTKKQMKNSLVPNSVTYKNRTHTQHQQ